METPLRSFFICLCFYVCKSPKWCTFHAITFNIMFVSYRRAKVATLMTKQCLHLGLGWTSLLKTWSRQHSRACYIIGRVMVVDGRRERHSKQENWIFKCWTRRWPLYGEWWRCTTWNPKGTCFEKFFTKNSTLTMMKPRSTQIPKNGISIYFLFRLVH